MPFIHECDLLFTQPPRKHNLLLYLFLYTEDDSFCIRSRGMVSADEYYQRKTLQELTIRTSGSSFCSTDAIQITSAVLFFTWFIRVDIVIGLPLPYSSAWPSAIDVTLSLSNMQFINPPRHKRWIKWWTLSTFIRKYYQITATEKKISGVTRYNLNIRILNHLIKRVKSNTTVT